MQMIIDLYQRDEEMIHVSEKQLKKKNCYELATRLQLLRDKNQTSKKRGDKNE